MEEIIQALWVFVGRLGGLAVIVLGLSSWIGKIWANKMMEKVKIKLIKELESYKKDLDRSNYVTKTQYDKEFSIYLEIWGALSKCVTSTLNLFLVYEDFPPDGEEVNKYNYQKWQEFTKDYNTFSSIIYQYSPFYDELLYDDFMKLKNLCLGQGNMFEVYKLVKAGKVSSDHYDKVYYETPKNIKALVESLRKESKKYFRSQKKIDNSK